MGQQARVQKPVGEMNMAPGPKKKNRDLETVVDDVEELSRILIPETYDEEEFGRE